MVRIQVLHQLSRQHLRRLHYQALPHDVRAAGSLILLYGMTVTRISRLRRDELEPTARTSGCTLVAIPSRYNAGRPAAPRPSRSAAAATGSSENAASAAVWLFLGGQPGRHTVALHKRLTWRGLPHAAYGRAAALIHLAADLPAPVLVDLLGIAIDTASQWAKHTSDDWATYLEAGTQERPQLRLRRSCEPIPDDLRLHGQQ
ncbi:hypothetical protein Cs7R123_47870 [Catellatospora sp. TT07R-123]|uniref:hypothetical protein n=1 Tax=Catellatospora sp. TT07R-123 TaxID=2733863 RepID=UPI001AFE0ED1|nr:hypothetical protein [Catellatospora sp. TT07R-123]GHJ47445.1 hypothetical protein Cs7R123_47870 [Catellatospora sp. TT07R-123]